MSDSFGAGEFLAGYLVEAEEHLAKARSHLLALDQASQRGEASPRAVRELFRSLHTIKGLSAMVGVEPVVDLAHALESLLRDADESGGQLGPAAVDRVLEAVGAIESRVRAFGEGRRVPEAPPELLAMLAGAATSGGRRDAEAPAPLDLPPEILAKLGSSERRQLEDAARKGQRVVRVDFSPSPERLERGLTITNVRERLSALGEVVKVVPSAVARSEASPGGLTFVLLLATSATDDELREATGQPDALHTLLEPAPRRPGPVLDEDEPEQAQSRFVRVDVSRLDMALDRLSALVVTRFRLERAVAELQVRGIDVRGLADILRENGRQLRDLRSAIMRARTVPVSDLLDRIPLLVRGLRSTTGKSVRVVTRAGKAELDKSVAERVFPAIVHLVRNAVDHGIEAPAERVRAGKPEEGTLRIHCEEGSNNELELCIGDDGAGIPAEDLARRAGVPVPTSEVGLLALLTRPGLSSSQETTRTSGRGLGMDIVKRTVDELGGTLHVRTSRGKGTAFTLRLPLSITIVDAFSVECAHQRFVVPVSMVEELLDVDAADVVRTPPTGAFPEGLRLVQRRGRAVPLVPLEHLLGRPAGVQAHRKALVVRRNDEPFAFEVERTLGQQEVVVRPLEDPLVRVPGVSGSTDLGDGRATLVLDLVALSAELARASGAPA